MKRTLLIPAVLAATFAAGTASAGEPGKSAPEREAWCKEHPAKCEEIKARREAFCKENPETCERRRAELEERKAWCEANPDKCKALKEERQERRQKLREKCEASPEECKKRREEMRSSGRQGRDDVDGGALPGA